MTKRTYKIPGKRVDPIGEEYQQMQSERQCRYCKLYHQSAYSTKIGICEQRGCTVCAHWECILDADGHLRVTRQKIVIS